MESDVAADAPTTHHDHTGASRPEFPPEPPRLPTLDELLSGSVENDDQRAEGGPSETSDSALPSPSAGTRIPLVASLLPEASSHAVGGTSPPESSRPGAAPLEAGPGAPGDPALDRRPSSFAAPTPATPSPDLIDLPSGPSGIAIERNVNALPVPPAEARARGESDEQVDPSELVLPTAPAREPIAFERRAIPPPLRSEERPSPNWSARGLLVGAAIGLLLAAAAYIGLRQYIYGGGESPPVDGGVPAVGEPRTVTIDPAEPVVVDTP
jgi:hypothetical protein